MKKLQIKMTNCYGIGELIHDFDFSKTNAILVYAPNGSMKTSFANSFSDYANNDSPKDLAWPERISKFECIDEKGVKIQSKSIFVVNPENREYDASPYVTSFLASQELKKRYDSIYNELETRKKDFIKDLKSISQSTDCEEEFINIFGTKEKSNFFQIIEAIFDEIISIEKMESFDFKYNDVFDKKNKVKEFLKEQSSLLNEYFSLYLNLLNQSSFFHKSESNSFGTYQANNILNTTNDNAFFEAGHKFVLSDKRTVSSYDKFKELITTEIDKIINDSKLKNTFEKIDKKLGGNQELRLFKNVIEKNNSLLPRLVDYEGFRRVVFLSYLVQLKDKTKQLIGLYNAKRKELEEIVYRANQESSKWHKILETYRNRFSVPFKVSIENQTDVILKQDTAHLVFEFEEKNNKIEQSKENLLRILSKGEQRAFFILQFIFEIEARKENAQDSLLIFDDISDSFDYKNKYAIIEYIKDFQDIDYFKSIILTHNFDFYRTIHSRLNKMQVLMAEKNEETRIVRLLPGNYVRDYFKNVLINDSKETICAESFITFIPFVRNIIEYLEDEQNKDYLKLTSCLHIKKDSSSITANEILTILKEKISLLKNATIDFGQYRIHDLILKTADSIYKNQNANEIKLENKIVLSIAMRLMAESIMIKRLKINLDDNTDTNQTANYFERYKKELPFDESSSILSQIVLMTPQNIHLNSFMYEPLIDMSLSYLKVLYQKVLSLKNIT